LTAWGLGLLGCGADGVAASTWLTDAAQPGPIDAAAAAGAWSQGPSMPDGPRQEFGVVAWRHLVFVIGGYDTATNRLNEAFNTLTNAWETHTPMTDGLGTDHPNVASTDDKVYVLGDAQHNLTLQYDPVSRSWLTKRRVPTARSAAATATIGTKIYLAGGSPTTAARAFEIYDAATDSWRTQVDGLPLLPGPGRNHVCGAAAGGTFYVIGGRSSGLTPISPGRVDAYDPATGAWTAVAPMITARAGAAAGVVRGVVYVVGGEGNAASPTGVFPQTEGYAPATDRWTRMPAMPVARHGLGAAGIGDTLYVPGGATVQGAGNTVATLDIFTP
jgi:N-acetylneuraminic acid mutarotase